VGRGFEQAGQTSTSPSASMNSVTKASSLLVFTPCACSGADVVDTILKAAVAQTSGLSHAEADASKNQPMGSIRDQISESLPS